MLDYVQGKVAASAVAAVASVLSEVPSTARKARVLPAMRRFWQPRSGGSGPEVQVALARDLPALLDGLLGCMDAEEDVLLAAACFKCALVLDCLNRPGVRTRRSRLLSKGTTPYSLPCLPAQSM